MIDDENLMDVLPLLRLEYMRAKSKHPQFPSDPADALAVVTEEMLELARAVNDGESRARVREEAAHVAVTAIRLLEEVGELNEPKFTPGPWRVVANFSRSYVCYGEPDEQDERFFPPGQCVCGCGVKGEECGDGNNTANSYLIAAAPEMYELLDCIRKSVALDAGIMGSCIARIEPLLKKARGEE